MRSIQASWTPLPLRSDSQGTCATSVLNRSKSALLKFKMAVLLVVVDTVVQVGPHKSQVEGDPLVPLSLLVEILTLKIHTMMMENILSKVIVTKEK